MTPEQKIYDSVEITNKENSEIEIRGEITAESLLVYKKKALEKLGKNAKVDGFRKGHVPEHILEQRLGGMAILEEAAELALSDAYPAIVLEEKLDVVGRPAISVTKLAEGNPVGFIIVAAVMPEVRLPDYKAFAKEVMSKPSDNTEPSDDEVKKVLVEIRKNKWRIDNKDKENAEKEPEEKDLPPMTDEMAQTLGEFKTVADVERTIREGMKREKEMQAKSKKRAELGEKIIEKTDVVLPRIFVEYELGKMLSQFKHDVTAVGMTFEAYLKKIDKTESDLKGEWKTDAEKRAKLQLALNKIAQEEKLVVTDEEVDREVQRILEQHKDADPENVRTYVATLLTNEKVFQLLENTAQPHDL